VDWQAAFVNDRYFDLAIAANFVVTDPPKNLQSFREFHRRIWAEEINLADNDLKILYGLIHWEQLLRNIRRTQFDEAI
jgi:hypothetical protein